MQIDNSTQMLSNAPTTSLDDYFVLLILALSGQPDCTVCHIRRRDAAWLFNMFILSSLGNMYFWNKLHVVTGCRELHITLS